MTISSAGRALTGWLAKTGHLDLRSLAFFRIGVASAILWDLAWRSLDLVAHYTYAGVLPQSPFVYGSPFFQSLFFVVSAFSAALLLLGWRSRWMAGVSFLLLALRIHRNPLVTTAGDTLLKLLLFWGMFLPLGERFSLDGRSRTARGGSGAFPAAGLALLLQVASVYFFAWLHKSGKEWWPDGNAAYYALSLGYLVTPFGAFLRELPSAALKSFTFFTYWLEAAAPFLLVLSSFWDRFRLAVVIVLAGLHVVFGLCFHLGIFPFVSFAALMAFLPGNFWVKEKKSEILACLDPKSGRFLKSLIWFCLILVFCANLAGLDDRRFAALEPFPKLAKILQLGQKWELFAPRPSRYDGWLVALGTLENGRQLNLLDPYAPLQWERPPAGARYANHRWRKFTMNLREKKWRRWRQSYAQYLCRQWNVSHPGSFALAEVGLYYLRQETLPQGRRGEVEKSVLLEGQACE